MKYIIIALIIGLALAQIYLGVKCKKWEYAGIIITPTFINNTVILTQHPNYICKE